MKSIRQIKHFLLVPNKLLQRDILLAVDSDENDPLPVSSQYSLFVVSSLADLCRDGREMEQPWLDFQSIDLFMSFSERMTLLSVTANNVKCIHKYILYKGTPFLGICGCYHIMFWSSSYPKSLLSSENSLAWMGKKHNDKFHFLLNFRPCHKKPPELQFVTFQQKTRYQSSIKHAKR